MEAPDKIYLEKEYPNNGVLPNGLNYTPSSTDIEYIRTDAFIEKACEWLGPVFKDLAGYYGGAELLEDFKNYIKGE